MGMEIYKEACEAYARYHKQLGNDFYDQPSRAASEVDGERVYLRNGKGVLARYNYTTKRLSWSRTDADRPEA